MEGSQEAREAKKGDKGEQQNFICPYRITMTVNPVSMIVLPPVWSGFWGSCLVVAYHNQKKDGIEGTLQLEKEKMGES